MTKLILPILFLSCCLYYACNDDCTVLIVDRQPIEPTNPCVNVNPVACSFEFREGKWIEVLDSVFVGLTVEDTIWFKQDSLIGWSFQGDNYLDLTGYFIGNYLFTLPWNGSSSNFVEFYTSYNDTTEYFTIHTAAGLLPVQYKKID